VLPTAAIFIVFFVIPVLLLLVIAFNPPRTGAVEFEWTLTLDGFRRFFDRPLYWEALIRSVMLSAITAFIALILGYPLAYLVAKERRRGRANLYMIMILASMQLDLIIRIYGMTVLLGDTGLINDALIRWGVIDQADPLPLMFNRTGVIIGLVQFTLPFMVLSLIGVIQAIEPSLEEAARSLGSGRWRTFFTITFPLTMPGVLAGSLLVFAIAIGSFAVPVLMGGSRVIVTPMQIAEQIQNSANWRFGAVIASLLFGVSLAIVFIYHRYTQKYIGGLV
jgi:putative spermidine/putrescine transport system permease protein